VVARSAARGGVVVCWRLVGAIVEHWTSVHVEYEAHAEEGVGELQGDELGPGEGVDGRWERGGGATEEVEV
jgi:hypothetical protein